MTDIETAAKADVAAIKADIAKANLVLTGTPVGLTVEGKIKTDVDGAFHWASSRLWVVALVLAGAFFLFRGDAAGLKALVYPATAIVITFLLGQAAVEVATVLKRS